MPPHARASGRLLRGPLRLRGGIRRRPRARPRRVRASRRWSRRGAWRSPCLSHAARAGALRVTRVRVAMREDLAICGLFVADLDPEAASAAASKTGALAARWRAAWPTWVPVLVVLLVYARSTRGLRARAEARPCVGRCGAHRGQPEPRVSPRAVGSVDAGDMEGERPRRAGELLPAGRHDVVLAGRACVDIGGRAPRHERTLACGKMRRCSRTCLGS